MSIMNGYPRLLVVFLLFGPGFSQALGHPQNISNATQEATLEAYSGKDVGTKATLAKKPEPSYTSAARKDKIEGTVILRCVFAANGKVTNIRVVSGLPDGLTDRAIKAAQKIRFKPATKGGKPVSMWMQLEYNFSL